MTPKKVASYDYSSIHAGHYDRVYKRNKGIQSKWTHLKFDHIRHALKDCKRHVDIGCGPGTFIGTLPDTICSSGFDIEQRQIDYANREYGSERKQFECVEPGKPFPVEEDSIDVITMTDLLEHLSADYNIFLMNEARRMLRTGGSVLITTPNYGSLWPVVEWFVNKLGEVSYEDQHINPYYRKTLCDLLQRTGFRNVAVDAFQFSAPFFGGISWKFADTIQKIEPKGIAKKIGLYLIARGFK